MIVARARFDPGSAPFTLEVRRVPVPVTASEHFIVALYRGQYVVTSFRYFWPSYTPQRVRISWPCINHFSVIFDEKYEAVCDWSWGRSNLVEEERGWRTGARTLSLLLYAGESAACGLS